LLTRRYHALPDANRIDEATARADEALDELARSRRASRSALVREALEQFAKGKRRSVTASAGDLVGSLEGPSDLATNKRHLSGYGR